MSDLFHDDADKVLAHVKATIGQRPDKWDEWPGGWRDDIESALVDAVFSARAVYLSVRGRGILAKVVAWQNTRQREIYSLEALIAEIDAVGVRGWRDRFGNRQRSPRRPASAPEGPTKAATVRQAAGMLLQEGINVACHIDATSTATAKDVLLSVPGIGIATSNYFLMLLGAPGVKPDRMIHRFVRKAAGHRFADAYAERVIEEAARLLGVQPHELDHAIWSYESRRARRCR